MWRLGFLLVPFAILSTSWAGAQAPLATLPNLVPNGGFEEGTKGWRVTIGPYGQGADPWAAAKGIAEVVSEDAFADKQCLRLNATKQDTEIDVSCDRFAVEGGKQYLLASRVRQVAGDGPYKVVIDWLDAEGKHLSYDNDWLGGDRPKVYAFHGGVFTAPPSAAQAVVLLGVQKGVECLFDDIRLSLLPGEPGPKAVDGEGSLEAALPPMVEAGGYSTFRLTYRAGEHGLPAGSALEFRRSNVDPRWSVPQAADPMAPGYTTVKARNGAVCVLQPGAPLQVPCVTRVSVVYPSLGPGETLEITYGDTAGGSPGAKVQPKVERDIRFVVAVDGDGDGRARDLPDTKGFDIVPGPFVRLGLITPSVVEAGRPLLLTLEARDAYGNIVPTYEGEVSLQAADRETTFTEGVRFDRRQEGRLPVHATLRRPGVRVLQAESGGAKAEQSIVVTKPAPPLPPAEGAGARAYEAQGAYVLENPHVRLIFPQNEFGYGVAFLEANVDGTWKRAGSFPSMGELWAGEKGSESTKTPIWLGSAGKSPREGVAGIILDGDLQAAGIKWFVHVACSLEPEARHVQMRCEIVPNGQASLRAFYGPCFYAGDGSFGATKAQALFPGLEYLTADEVSSGDYGIVPPYSERLAPHPYKITVPLMAVAGDGLCTMVFWNPNWGMEKRPTHRSACFDSPARREDREAHLLGVFGPSVLEGVPENAREMPEPYVLEPKTPLIQVVSVGVVPGDNVTAAMEYWLKANGVPDPPKAPRGWEEEKALVARGLLETGWDPEKKGWHSALADPWGASYNPDAALLLWYYAREHPGSPLAAAIDAELDQAWAAGGKGGFDLAFHLGDAAAALSGLQSAGVSAAFAMSPEGAYAYHPHTGNKMFSQAQAKSLGREGEINVGTCAMGLEPLMRAAYFTGDPLLVQHGEKGLAYLDRFVRPQGAENWEVPLACPNLRAAALSTRCYLYGYLLTGKDAYLARARYWAETGLPFIYLWNADDRPIMRYASISVMGTSLYTGTWFGNAVQWVGLVYADAIRELAPYDRSFPWEKVADGVLISAMQQQKTDASPCKHVGFYPDSYSPVKGDETYHWCLAPNAIGHLVNALHGLDARASATVLRVGDRTIHIVSPGRITNAAFGAGTLRFTSDHLAGLTHEIVLARVATAAEVAVDGVALPRSDLKAEADLGWQQTPYGFLVLRIKPTSAQARIELRGCELMEPKAEVDLRAIANGGFEAGLLSWSPGPAERARIVADAHAGATALELDATGLADEVQCSSRPMLVTGGRTYELSAWVKQTAGDGIYKVTIDWSGAGGHLRYDNDWMGSSHPAQYTLHGGRFTAPADAQTATIILGVRAETRCLFDDVALREAGEGAP